MLRLNQAIMLGTKMLNNFFKKDTRHFLKIKWNKLAIKQPKIKSLPNNLDIFQRDRLKKDNDESFHALDALAGDHSPGKNPI